MIERCWDILALSSLTILLGMLFDPANFLGLKFEIILIISSYAQVKMKIESLLGGGK